MSKRKTIEEVEDATPPQALIMADNYPEIASHLAKILTTRGCQVKVTTHAQPVHEKFDYIFQFKNFSASHHLFNKCLAKNGKFLFVEIDGEEIGMGEEAPFKILRLGDSSVWEVKEVVDKILRSIFSASQIKVINAAKVPKLTKIPQPLTPPPIPKIIKHTPPKSTSRILILFFIFFLPIILAAGYVSWISISFKNDLKKLEKHISASHWLEAKNGIISAQKRLKTLNTIYDFSWSVLFPIRQIQIVKDTGTLLTLTNNVLSAGSELLGDTSVIDPQVVIASEKKIVTLEKTLVEARQRLESLSLPYLNTKKTVSAFISMQEKLTPASEILPLVKKLFFTDSPKTYLLLFQNNMELRPTGGFIGSFGLLTVKDGKMLDFQVLDVYTADGQLKGHVEPPSPIRKYLSQPNWFLRDSNFDPDFAKSGAVAAWFLQKELGHTVDGVIGVNLFFVQNLLRLLGSVKLTDFKNEIITADNFFFKAQFYAQHEFFEGSTQKRDFLTTVANAIQLRFSTSHDLPIFDLTGVVKTNLDEKNLLLWSGEAEISHLIEEKGWGGRIVNVSCVNNLENCRADYLAINEANLGVNKVNYFVTKSVEIAKKIDSEGNLLTTLTLSYENRNIGDILAGGTYTNYLRFLLPSAARFSGMTLNTLPVTEEELETETYGSDKTSYAYLLKIAPENKAVVKFSYLLPQFFNSTTINYQFFFQKQAGDKLSPLVFSINLPEELMLTPLNFKSEGRNDHELIFTTDTSVDRIFALERL